MLSSGWRGTISNFGIYLDVPIPADCHKAWIERRLRPQLPPAGYFAFALLHDALHIADPDAESENGSTKRFHLFLKWPLSRSLTVDNNGPLAVFTIALNNRCHLRRFGFSLFDRGRI